MPTGLPPITVITPSCNQGGYIEQTIRSVLDQDYPGLDYIIMDGGSDDGTLEILRRYEGRLRWWSEKDSGPAEALNKGLRLARGEIIAYLNSDDLYAPGALLAVGRYFKDHPRAEWLTGRCRIIDRNGRPIRRLISLYKEFWLTFHHYNLLLVLDYISQPATFWRRSLFDRLGGFQPVLPLDYDFSLRVGRQARLHFIRRNLASFRLHPASRSSLQTDSLFASDLQVASRFSRSRLLLGLHRLHNRLILAGYRRMRIPRGDEHR